LKCIGFYKVDFSEYAENTLQSILDSIKVRVFTGELLKLKGNIF
jgi:hypothetical protein